MQYISNFLSLHFKFSLILFVAKKQLFSTVNAYFFFSNEYSGVTEKRTTLCAIWNCATRTYFQA